MSVDIHLANRGRVVPALAFAALIVFLVVAGSAWIMSDLAEGMMAGQTSHSLAH